MDFDKVITAVAGMIGVIFTYWFFLMKKDQAIEVTDEVGITVDGGYSPDVISILKGKTTKINFLRKDPSSCLEEIVLADFKIKKFLPLNQKVTVEITPKEEGEYRFSCGMNMFHGKIIVR